MPDSEISQDDAVAITNDYSLVDLVIEIWSPEVVDVTEDYIPEGGI